MIRPAMISGVSLRRKSAATTSSLCVCVKNEAPYLLEWIAYHKVWGFDEIVVYDDGSTDRSRDLLVALARRGEIVFIPLAVSPAIAPQLDAYAREFARASKTEWTLLSDIDEFLVLRNHAGVDEYLAEFSERVSQISLNWRIFGSSGAIEPTGVPVTERFRRCSLPNFEPNAHTKSFVRRSRIDRPGVHFSAIRSGLSVRDDGRLVRRIRNDWTEDVSLAVAFIHHYVVKSRTEFAAKIERGQGTEPPGSPNKARRDAERFWDHHDRNEETSDLALRRLDEIKAEIARLERIVAAT